MTASVESLPRETRGLILHLQRLSTEDGPGIRTTVFFKGCPLRCEWCHNPESLSPHAQIHWLEVNCIACETCLDICPQQALAMSSEGVVIDRVRCDGCGMCAQVCPAHAIELLGIPWRVSELCAELIKDRIYYEKSGGGVTLSGGEPAMQPEFASQLLAALRDEGVHTALDTSGMCSYANLEKLASLVDLVLFDIKEIESERHQRYTGHGNQRILDNLSRLAGYLALHPEKRLWVRTPLIPGRTARRENLERIGDYLATHLGGLVARWDLCAFNNLCAAKYARLGLNWALAEESLLSASELDDLAQAARSSGVEPHIVITSGATRLGVP